MFLIKLFMLPFRGLWLMLIGGILSIPVILLAGILWPNFWAPKVLETFCLGKTDFSCIVRKSDIKPIAGEYSVKNVAIGNPINFMSTDFIQFNEVSLHMPVAQFFKTSPELKKVVIDVGYLGFIIDGNGENNIAEFFEKIWKNIFNEDKEVKKRSFSIDEFVFRFKGVVAVRDYYSSVPRTREFTVSFEKNYANVIHNSENAKLMLGSSQYTDYTRVIGDIERELSNYGIGIVVQTFLESTKKVPALTSFVQ